MGLKLGIHIVKHRQERRSLFLVLIASIFALLNARNLNAQTQLKITADSHILPIAVPVFCDRGNANKYANQVAEALLNDLRLPGIFSVLEPKTYPEPPGTCMEGDAWMPAWTTINANLVVRGEVKLIGTDSPEVDAALVLYDTVKHQALLTKHYTVSARQALTVAHRFAAEVVEYFHGESSVFGTKLAYIEASGEKTDVYLMDVQGTNAVQVTHDGAVLGPLAWSPDASKLLYASKKSGRPELHFVNIREGSTKEITNLPGISLGATFFSDGKNLLGAAKISGSIELIRLNLWGRVADKVSLGGGDKTFPSLSPDEKQVAFTLQTTIGSAVYLANAEGGVPRKLNDDDKTNCTTPAWSPTGTYVAFSCEQQGARQIFIRPPDGGPVMQITFSGTNETPTWSPDGKALAFSSSETKSGPRHISIFSLQGVRSWQVSTAKHDQSFPAWSPTLN